MRYLLTLLMLSAVLVACEKDGPAERAGEEIDEAVEQVTGKSNDMSDDVEDAVDAAKGKVEEAGDAVEEAADSIDKP